VVPFVGPWIVASAKTAVVAGQHMLSTSEYEHAELAKILANKYLDALAEIASAHSPLVLIIENAHRIDNASSSLLSRLATKAPEQGMTIIVTYRTNEVNTQHPLHAVMSETRSRDLPNRLS
jgi:predicted ATPase